MPNQTHNIDWNTLVNNRFSSLKDTTKQQRKDVNEMSRTLAEIIETAEELESDIGDLQNDIDENYIVRPKWPEYLGIAELIDTLIVALPTPDYGKQEQSLRQLHEFRQACAKANIVDLNDIIKHINNG